MKWIVLSLVMISTAHADIADYDVDWNPVRESGYHILRITINNCTTQFKIKDKDFYNATANDKALTEALVKAVDRSSRGCN